MLKFPSVDQFRNAIRTVKDCTAYTGKDENGDPIFDYSRSYPTLHFRGYVKLHGTNAGVIFNPEDSSITCQSRERVIEPGPSDNAGFAQFMYDKTDFVVDIYTQVCDILGIWNRCQKVAIYGEWCGKGIQRGVAISELDRMFVVFAVRAILDDGKELWIDPAEFDIDYPEQRIFNIATFGWYSLDIDFNKPELAQNSLIEMTTWVENECPVGKYFGVSGTGEGLVWTCLDPSFQDIEVRFKTKGEKHSTSKVKTLAEVDVEAIENLNKLVEAVVTDSRLDWALDNMIREQQKPFEMESMGDFIRTVYNDVVKEELDLIEASGFDAKKMGSPIANKARPWYVNRLNVG